jgi:hypothetical protein
MILLVEYICLSAFNCVPCDGASPAPLSHVTHFMTRNGHVVTFLESVLQVPLIDAYRLKGLVAALFWGWVVAQWASPLYVFPVVSDGADEAACSCDGAGRDERATVTCPLRAVAAVGSVRTRDDAQISSVQRERAALYCKEVPVYLYCIAMVYVICHVSDGTQRFAYQWRHRCSVDFLPPICLPKH